MATSYPGALDTLTNPTGTDYQDTVDHAAQHTNANDAIEAIQAELGTDPAGTWSTVKARLDDMEAGVWAPSDSGLLAANFDPAAMAGSTALGANGTVYAMKLWTPAQISVTNIVMHVNTAGASLTSGQNFAGLFDSSKGLVDTSADQSTSWTSTGLKTMPLASGPFNISAGYFYVAVFANGTTRPAFSRGSNIAVINGALSAANARWASSSTGRTTSFPATLGSFTAASNAYWCGVS